MTAKKTLDTFSACPAYSTIANFGKVDFHLTRQRQACKVTDAQAETVQINDKRFSYPTGAFANNSDSSVYAIHYNRTCTAWNRLLRTSWQEKNGKRPRKNWREEAKLLAKFITHRPASLEMLEKFESRWDGLVGRINRPEHRIVILNDEFRPVQSPP